MVGKTVFFTLRNAGNPYKYWINTLRFPYTSYLFVSGQLWMYTVGKFMIISFASSASFDLMSFSNSAKAVSLSFIFLMIGFVIFMLIIVFITHLPLRLLPSRTIIFSSCNLTSNLFTVESNTFIFSASSLNDAIIGFFGFDFKSLSE